MTTEHHSSGHLTPFQPQATQFVNPDALPYQIIGLVVLVLICYCCLVLYGLLVAAFCWFRKNKKIDFDAGNDGCETQLDIV